MTSAARVLPLVALLALAGCAAPFGGVGGGSGTPDGTTTATDAPTASTTATATPTTDRTATPTTTTIPGPSVTVYGSLPVDANRTWRRVQSMLGTDVRTPQVSVREPTEGGRPLRLQGAFGATLGIGNVSLSDGPTAPPLAERYRTATPGTKLFLGPYHFGARYVADRVDDPRNLSRVYETPPSTAEQVIHGYLPGEEPPTNLSVGLTEDAPVPTRSDVMGEHFVRVALQVELSRSRAVDAAAGWGADRLYGFQSDGQHGYVRVLDWDDRANASAFERAFRAYAAARPDGTRFETERVTPTTVAVVVGPPRFVGNTTVRTDGDAVVVAPLDW